MWSKSSNFSRFSSSVSSGSGAGFRKADEIGLAEADFIQPLFDVYQHILLLRAEIISGKGYDSCLLSHDRPSLAFVFEKGPDSKEPGPVVIAYSAPHFRGEAS